MSRIEKGSNVKEELEQMKGEVIKEISSTKKRSPLFSCSAIALIAIVLIVIGGMWAVAATGIVKVPLFSGFAHKEQVPERVVTPGVPVEAIIKEQVESTVAKRLHEGGEIKETSILVTFTEESITASLLSILEESNNTMIDSSGSQVSISEKLGFTFFLPVVQAQRKTSLRVSVKASIIKDTVELKPEEFYIGALRIPNVLTAFFLQPFIHSQLTAINKAIGSYIQIKDISFTDGGVTVRGILSVKVE